MGQVHQMKRRCGDLVIKSRKLANRAERSYQRYCVRRECDELTTGNDFRWASEGATYASKLGVGGDCDAARESYRIAHEQYLDGHKDLAKAKRKQRRGKLRLVKG